MANRHDATAGPPGWLTLSLESEEAARLLDLVLAAAELGTENASLLALRLRHLLDQP